LATFAHHHCAGLDFIDHQPTVFKGADDLGKYESADQFVRVGWAEIVLDGSGFAPVCGQFVFEG